MSAINAHFEPNQQKYGHCYYCVLDKYGIYLMCVTRQDFFPGAICYP